MTASVSPAAFIVAPVAPPRASDDVARQIREHIISGQLRPGDRLPAERDLAAQFQVARSTLREALRALELNGLIVLKKGGSGGAFVAHGDVSAVRNGLIDLYHLGAISPQHLTEARIGISEIVVRAACQRLTEDELAQLAANVALAAQAHANGDFHGRTAQHQRFHLLLAQATRNPVLIANMEALVEILRLFVASIGPVDVINVLPSRQRLLKHLKARDADAAVKEMTDSLERVHRQFLSLWEETDRHA